MAIRQKDDLFSRSVLFYAAAALIVLSLLPGCATFSAEEKVQPKQLTQAEKIADLKQRLLATHHKMHMQRAELQKLLGNKADLDSLIRSLQVKQQKMSFHGENAGKMEEVTVDYLQVLTANQAALKNDLTLLMAELDALTAAPAQ